MSKTLIFLFFFSFCGLLKAQEPEVIYTHLTSEKSQAVIDRFVYSPILNTDKEVFGLKRNAEKLLKGAKVKNHPKDAFFASNLLFLFHTKPLSIDSCLYYLSIQKGARVALKTDSHDARIFKNQAYLYGVQNKPEEEMTYLLKAAQVFEKYKDWEGLAGTYMNLATLFSKRNEVGQKKTYEAKAMALAKGLPNKLLLNTIQINQAFGLLYSSPDSVIILARHIIESSRKKNIAYQEGLAYHLLAESYLQKKDYTTAISYADTVQQFFGGDIHSGALINSYFDKSEALFYLGSYKQSLDFANKSLALAQEKQAYYSIYALHQHMANIYKNQGDFGKALYHQEVYTHLKDSLYSIEKTKAIQELETQYETAKKERDIARLNQEKGEEQKKFQSKIFLISGLLIALIGLAVIWSLYLRNKGLKAKTYSMDLERRLFKSQIDPHFAFNTLSSIQASFLEEKSAKEAALYLAKFSRMLRAVFKSNNQRFIPLEEEMLLIKNYLELQQLRFDHAFTFDINVNQTLGNLKIPPMLIQPLIENAIEHGQVYKVENGHIAILVDKVDNQRLKVKIIDNGLGMDHEKNFESNGLASNLIKDQLKSLEREFKIQCYLRVEENKTSGVTSEIVLPCFETL